MKLASVFAFDGVNMLTSYDGQKSRKIIFFEKRQIAPRNSYPFLVPRQAMEGKQNFGRSFFFFFFCMCVGGE